MTDIRYAGRGLRRSPAFALIAVLSLGIGIGFNTAVFTAIDAILVRPLPVEAPDRLVDVYTSGAGGDTYATTSYPDFLDFRARNSVFTDMIGHSAMLAAINLKDRSRLSFGEVVTGNYFRMLGVGAAQGRMLVPADDAPGAERVVVVSDRYWRREHGERRDAVGQTIRLRGQTYTIVGVAPRGFTGMTPMLSPELWLPIAHAAEIEPAGIQDVVASPAGTTRLDRRGQRWLFVKGRLKSGETVEQARANLDVLMRQLTAAHPQTNKDRRIAVKATSSIRVHPEVDTILLSIGAGLMVAVSLVLLVACANVASLLLARASARQKEIGIRLALGAGRSRVVRQLLTESLVLASIGAAAGTLLAWWLTSLVAALNLPIPIPLALDLRVDARVLAFTAGVSVLGGFAAGLAPALRASSPNLIGNLRGEVVVAHVRGRLWTLRDGLVAGQVAVTAVLLIAAGLLTRSLLTAQKANIGFRPEGLAVVSVDLAMLRYDEARSREFFDRALARLGAMPGVESVALAARLPFSLNFSVDPFYIPGYQRGPGDRPFSLQNTRVSPDYFKTLGIPILQGRNFNGGDTPRSPGVIIVNETAARLYWPGQNAVGKPIHQRSLDGPTFEIVGVAADHKVQTVGEAAQPYVHFAQSQQPESFQVIVARTRRDAGALLTRIRRELLALDPGLVFIDNQTMEAQISATLFPARAGAWIVSAVGVIAMVLAAVGLYGTIAYSVARRTREIGIRMALGGQRSKVMGLIMRQGLTVAGTGLIGGCLLAAAATRTLAGVLYGVSVADPIAWSLAAVLLLGVAATANLVPAYRASRVDPSAALRAE